MIEKRREKAYLLTPSASCLLPLLLFEVSGKRERRRLHEKIRRDEMRDSERRKIEKDREVMNDMRIL